VTRNALLGLAVIVFCVAGLAVGIVRLIPGSNGADMAIAAVAAILGGAAFPFVLRVGRRGAHPWMRWLVVPILLGAIFVDRLSERWQLALLALAAGYVTVFLATVVVRAVRLTR
jgi:hypothetical protein